jgi:hypothetical protein
MGLRVSLFCEQAGIGLSPICCHDCQPNAELAKQGIKAHGVMGTLFAVRAYCLVSCGCLLASPCLQTLFSQCSLVQRTCCSSSWCIHGTQQCSIADGARLQSWHGSLQEGHSPSRLPAASRLVRDTVDATHAALSAPHIHRIINTFKCRQAAQARAVHRR